ncbi:acetate--CoA ligase family protein [Pseudonocardia lutea]|uniref:Acetate--CoA ligase family protein n=1 Tax=Pseudonocardia lutea TaxID=2172015 RepID=A0ABW1IBR7_9PSEU
MTSSATSPVSDLVTGAVALSSAEAGGVAGRVSVPEPRVKALLAQRGVVVPRSATAARGDRVDASALTGPVVLKAFGPGLLHKSDVGAVRLGLAPAEVDEAVAAMDAALAARGITPDGFLVEEQHPGGTELIVGVVRDATFGHVLLLGLGGVATELLGLHALRVAPLSEDDARALVEGFPGAPLLSGARGRAPVDTEALVRLLLAVAGPDGLVAAVGDALVEFECNPVVVTPEGATALDARLVLEPDAAQPAPTHPATAFDTLFAPRTIAVAGASTKRPSFGNRFLAGYREMGWTDGLYALHPSAAEVDGVPAVAGPADVPGGLDYLVVAVPARAVPEVVAAAAAAGTAFVHVITGGFAEMGAEGAELQQRVADAVRGTGTRLIGPNCLGVFAPAGRQTFTLGAPKEGGSVAVVSQSGGLSGDLVTVGSRRGVRFGKVVSIGNAIDVTQAELLGWLVDDPETEVVGLYVEGTKDGRDLLAALRRADGHKPVVALRGGSSVQGSAAVASHTGSMAGATQVWEAVAEATGLTLVETLEDLVAGLGYLQHHRHHVPAPGAEGVLVIGLGGGASVLATDACDRAGLTLTPLRDGLRETLRDNGFGAGTSVANPLEVPVGPASPTGIVGNALAPILAADGQPYLDLLVHVNVASYYSYGTAGLAPLVAELQDLVARRYPVRLAVVTRNADVAAGEDADLLRRFVTDTGIRVHPSFDEAARAIAAAQRFDARRV